MTMRVWRIAKHAAAVSHAQSHGQAERGHVESFITVLRTKSQCDPINYGSYAIDTYAYL